MRTRTKPPKPVAELRAAMQAIVEAPSRLDALPAFFEGLTRSVAASAWAAILADVMLARRDPDALAFIRTFNALAVKLEPDAAHSAYRDHAGQIRELRKIDPSNN